MAIVKFTVELKWISEQTNLCECTRCKDVIYSDMFRLYTNIDGELNPVDNVIICASCFDVINNAN